MKLFFRILTMALTGSLLCGMSALAEPAYDTAIFTQAMIERSLISVGNTQRMQAAIAKAARGEEVTLAYLGGSITEGGVAKPEATKCYAYLSAQIFAEKYCADPNQVKYVNAGVAGTPSLLGITRCEQDVLSKKPDVVFVEFAVNDSGDAVSCMAYESLVRKLLTSETSPAVVLLFTVRDNGSSSQPHMQQVGEHYDLGMISVGNAINPEIMLDHMRYTDYSPDYAHPNNAGHAFIADMIGYYFDQAATTPAQPYEMPKDVRYGGKLENLTNIRDGSELIADTGSFDFGPASCYSYVRGWKYDRLGKNIPLTLRLECSAMTIAFKQEKNTFCGTAEVYVDGKLASTLKGYASTAWGNVVTVYVDMGEQSALHTVEIRMAGGDETKSFTLLDIAYAP